LLGDACVLAVPAEYASPSSGSSDHPQQYCLHHFWSGGGCTRRILTTDSSRGKAFFPILLLSKKNIRALTHFISPRKTPEGPQHTPALPPRGSCIPAALYRTFWGGVALVAFLWFDYLAPVYMLMPPKKLLGGGV